MSALLRHPGIVPSLFSDGTDDDRGPLGGASLPRRAVALVASGLSLLWLYRDSFLLKPGAAVLGSLTAVLCSRPMLAVLLVGSTGSQ